MRYARTTLPDLMQVVQTLALRTWPLASLMVIFCTFGLNMRLLTRCEWLMVRPATGALPQISHFFDILITPCTLFYGIKTVVGKKPDYYITLKPALQRIFRVVCRLYISYIECTRQALRYTFLSIFY